LKNIKKSIKLVGMDKDSHITKLLKSAYEKSGKTHADICKEVNLTQSYISRLLNGGQSISLAKLIKIGKAIDLDAKQITTAWKKDKIEEIDAEIAKFIKTT